MPSASDVLLGFVVTRPVPCPAYLEGTGLGEEIVSLSDCLAYSVPFIESLGWIGAPDARGESALAAFGLNTRDIPRLAALRESLAHRDLTAPVDLLRTIEAVREVLDAFPSIPEVRVFAVGSSGDDVAQLVRELGDITSDLGRWLGNPRSIPNEARLRGYEIIGIESGICNMHSWHCNSLLDHVRRSGDDAEINEWGLFVDGDAARSWAEAFRRDELGEPVHWIAVSLLELDADAIASIARQETRRPESCFYDSRTSRGDSDVGRKS